MSPHKNQTTTTTTTTFIYLFIHCLREETSGGTPSDRGGGQEEEEEEEEEELTRKSRGECSERNVLSNIDVFNSKFCQTTVSDNTIVEEGEAALERARKTIQTLKGMVQDLESVAEDALMNVGMNVNSSSSNDKNEEKIRNIVRERKFAMKRVQGLFRKPVEETKERYGR